MNAYINHEKRFAFLEARSVEEASNALAFDGLPFRGELLKASGQVMYGWPLAGSQYQRIPLLSFATLSGIVEGLAHSSIELWVETGLQGCMSA